jgi:hypothetical protein
MPTYNFINGRGLAWLAVWPFQCLFLCYHCSDLEECLVPLLLLHITLSLLLLGLLYFHGRPWQPTTCLSKCHNMYMSEGNHCLRLPPCLKQSLVYHCVHSARCPSAYKNSPLSLILPWSPWVADIRYKGPRGSNSGSHTYMVCVLCFLPSLSFSLLLLNILFLCLSLSIGYIFEFWLSFSCSVIC